MNQSSILHSTKCYLALVSNSNHVFLQKCEYIRMHPHKLYKELTSVENVNWCFIKRNLRHMRFRNRSSISPRKVFMINIILTTTTTLISALNLWPFPSLIQFLQSMDEMVRFLTSFNFFFYTTYKMQYQNPQILSLIYLKQCQGGSRQIFCDFTMQI